MYIIHIRQPSSGHSMCLFSSLLSLDHRFPNWGTRTPRGTRSGSGGTLGENVRDNGKRTELPFETELQLSDGNIILCIKIAQIPLYFFPARLYFFLINTTTIATMNKH